MLQCYMLHKYGFRGVSLQIQDVCGEKIVIETISFRCGFPWFNWMEQTIGKYWMRVTVVFSMILAVNLILIKPNLNKYTKYLTLNSRQHVTLFMSFTDGKYLQITKWVI